MRCFGDLGGFCNGKDQRLLRAEGVKLQRKNRNKHGGLLYSIRVVTAYCAFLFLFLDVSYFFIFFLKFFYFMKMVVGNYLSIDLSLTKDNKLV